MMIDKLKICGILFNKIEIRSFFNLFPKGHRRGAGLPETPVQATLPRVLALKLGATGEKSTYEREDFMEIAFLIGRIIVGAYYLFNALNHFNVFGQTGGLAAWASSKGVPASRPLVYVAGALLAIGGLTILTGIMPTIGVIALIVFFIPVTYKMHDFWTETDPGAKWNQIHQFIKNVGLLGSALMFLAIPQPWPLSLGQ